MKKLNLILSLIFISSIVFSQSTFEQLHKQVKKFPNGKFSYEEIADKLAKKAKGDLDKAKLIYLWIAENIDYDIKSLNAGKTLDGSPKVTLKRKKAVCDGYAKLYNAMGEHLGLDVTIIDGYAKSDEKDKVSKNVDHSWNYLIIGNKNILIDVTWGAGSIDKLTNRFVSKTSYYYFDTEASNFVFAHLPEKSEYQNLDNPVLKNEFKQMPYVDKDIFISKIITGKDLLSSYRAGQKLNIPSSFSTLIEYNIIKAPAEMKVGKTYDFIIQSSNGENLIYHFNGKQQGEILEKNNINTFEFSFKVPKKGRFSFSISNNDIYKGSYSTIFKYLIN